MRGLWWTVCASVAVVSIVATPAPAQQAVEDRTPTFHQDIGPILKASCTPCHSSGGPGPFRLETYDDFAKRSELVRFQILARLMPPIVETSDFGGFSQVHQLTDEQTLLYQRWLQAGMPEGSPSPQQATTQPDEATGGKRVTLESPQTLPPVDAEGPRYWQQVVIDLPADVISLSGVSLIPRTPQSLLNAKFALVGPEQSVPAVTRETHGVFSFSEANPFGVWAHGYRPLNFGDAATPIKPGSKLVVLTLLQPSGREVDAGFTLALTSPESAGTNHLRQITIDKGEFTIKAETTPTISLSTTLDKPLQLRAVVPEARYYATRVTLIATYPNGRTATLYDTLRWDPTKVGNYQFSEPVSLPAGTVVTGLFNYSNDEKCRMNEGRKPADVVSGSAIDQEVCRFTLIGH